MSVIELASSARRIIEPGIYYDGIDEESYHADPVEGGSLSSTGARVLTHKTPAHFAWLQSHPRKPKRAFDLGTAFHTDVLGKGGRYVLIEADNYNRKIHQQQRDDAWARGKTPILLTQADDVARMAGAVRAHRTAGKLFARTDCHAEVTAVGRDPETGVMCRIRIDWLLPIVEGQPVRFVDLKSADDASPAGMAKSMLNWHYAQQLDFYISTLRWALGLPDDHPVLASLIAAEKDQPHLVGMGQPDEQAMAWAHEDNRKARHRYARHTASGHWPGYSEDVVPLSLPGWRLHAYEHQYPGDVYDPELDTYGGTP